MNHELRIVPTADGSNTIYNPQVGENYHSTHGALQESRHVFLKSGLQYFLNHVQATASEVKVSPTGGDYSQDNLFFNGVHENSLEGAKHVSILEVGFGTGLNFLLTADFCAAENISLNYTGIEAYPLTNEMIGLTGYNQYISSEVWQQFVELYPQASTGEVLIHPKCKLQIAHCQLNDFQSAQQYDIIYFDAFAVGKQPEMWEDAAIAHTIKFLKPGGVFVTYAITGNLKRTLKALGCKVEKAPGAPGKREMLRALNR